MANVLPPSLRIRHAQPWVATDIRCSAGDLCFGPDYEHCSQVMYLVHVSRLSTMVFFLITNTSLSLNRSAPPLTWKTFGASNLGLVSSPIHQQPIHLQHDGIETTGNERAQPGVSHPYSREVDNVDHNFFLCLTGLLVRTS